MRFLGGWKTVLVVAGMLATIVFPHVAPDTIASALNDANNIVLGASGLLTVLGIIHKREKSKRVC